MRSNKIRNFAWGEFQSRHSIQDHGTHHIGRIFQQIETYLKNKNGIYAIRITGTFNHIKTRAFLSFIKEPFPLWQLF